MKKDETFEVNYKQDKYNIYEFLNNHPGGTNYVKPYEQKDITRRMEDHQHSKAAYYLLKEYKDGGRNKDKSEEDLEVGKNSLNHLRFSKCLDKYRGESHAVTWVGKFLHRQSVLRSPQRMRSLLIQNV